MEQRINDKDLSSMLRDMENQPTINAKQRWALLDLQDARKQLKKYPEEPSLKVFLQLLANKHNLTFTSDKDGFCLFYVSNRTTKVDAEDFFGFDRDSFDDDFYLDEIIAPIK